MSNPQEGRLQGGEEEKKSNFKAIASTTKNFTTTTPHPPSGRKTTTDLSSICVGCRRHSVVAVLVFLFLDLKEKIRRFEESERRGIQSSMELCANFIGIREEEMLI